MIQGVVYFNGPASQWSQKIDEKEIIARASSKWLWVVRMLVRNAYSGLDPSRCGYAIVKDGVTLEHVEAK